MVERVSGIARAVVRADIRQTSRHLIGRDGDRVILEGRKLALLPALRMTVAHPTGGVCVITVDGELDMLTAPQLRAYVGDQLAARPAHLILDLKRLDFLGVSGLSCLLQAHEMVSQTSNSHLHLAGPFTPAVARLLDVIGLRGLFDTYPTRAEALDTLAAQTAPGCLPSVPTRAPDDSCVFTAWWCSSVGTTWTLELHPAAHPMLGRPAEWICSGVPIDQPAPTQQQTEHLLGEWALLLFPGQPGSRTRHTGSRQLIGCVIRHPEVIKQGWGRR